MSAGRPEGSALSVALDLGSTFLKAGRLDAGGEVEVLAACPAPPLSGSGPIREGDAESYAEAAEGLLRELAAQVPRGTPLGLASQRSTFVLWDRRDGRPLMPMISWQDCRAADWCERHAGDGERVRRHSGLVLSGHYAGPKLAAIQEADPELRRALRSGHVLFGNLDSWLAWRCSGGRLHATDGSMAARTSLFDIAGGAWSDELLDCFDVPREILPEVRPTSGEQAPLNVGLRLAAVVADQAGGALALLGDADDTAMVNLGTGGFVLRSLPQGGERFEGYLTGLVRADASGRRFTVEGAINGAGSAVDRHGTGPTELPDSDPAPGAFCLPDVTGLGAPHWRADLRYTLSDEALALEAAGRRRVTLEGLLFRIREILDDLAPARVMLSGGLSREPLVAQGLAALIGRPVELLEFPEAVLCGAARLAAGLTPGARPATLTIEPASDGAWLPAKYARWRSWLARLLAG